MSEPIYDPNDRPLDILRYRQYQRDQGEDCTESTEPVTVNIHLEGPWYCLPKTFPTDPDSASPKDNICKTQNDWIKQIKDRGGLSWSSSQSYWILFFTELTGYNSQQECEQNCQKRWFCNDADEECELLDVQNPDGSYRPGLNYVLKEECEQNCPTSEPPSETPSPS